MYFFIIVRPAFADLYDAAYTAYSNEDYETAAKFGHAKAQYRMGIYHFKEAPEVNETLGFYWMQSAADNEHPNAQTYLDSGS